MRSPQDGSVPEKNVAASSFWCRNYEHENGGLQATPAKTLTSAGRSGVLGLSEAHYCLDLIFLLCEFITCLRMPLDV